MFFRSIFAIVLFLTFSASAHGANFTVESPEIKQGSVTIFRITDVDTSSGASANFNGGDLFIRVMDDGLWGVVGADLTKRPGEYRVKVMIGGDLYTKKIRVVNGKFKVERLTLPKDKVNLSASAVKRANREKAELKKALKNSNGWALWSGSFIIPAKGRLSSNFGNRRILNGAPRSPHSGIDVAAVEGTTVKASNRGRVAFVGDFFFKGNFIVIDHGLGLFTSYSHLSSVDVKSGEIVEKGAPIGAIGSTGRVTGPHLHFAANIGSARVSPNELFRISERLAALDGKKPRFAFLR